MVNIKNIAEACQCSIATVSRALRNNGYVEKAKKELILSKAHELGYFVDINAQRLKTGSSKTIGIIISDIHNPFYSMILEKIIERFSESSYRTIISYSFENDKNEKEALETMMSNKVEAIIFTPVSNANQATMDIVRMNKIPVLQLFRQAYKEFDTICINDTYGSYIATRYLLSKGYERIALLSVKLNYTPSRSKGYKEAYAEANKEVDESLIKRFKLGRSIEYDLITAFNNEKIDAIVAGTNTFGKDAIYAMKKLNKQIPIVVFDNLDWMKLLDITTVSQPLDELYEEVTSNILDKLENNGQDEAPFGKLIKIRPELIVRKD